ncbi:MAG: hypothetical protein HY322_20740 [Betaproteobacteria bacterium]|nr:hypothetical protein [Betaproteobacteria bacterium]
MNAPAEKLVIDFKTLIADTEDLLKASAGSAGEKLADARVKAQQALAEARGVGEWGRSNVGEWGRSNISPVHRDDPAGRTEMLL